MNRVKIDAALGRRLYSIPTTASIIINFTIAEANHDRLLDHVQQNYGPYTISCLDLL